MIIGITQFVVRCELDADGKFIIDEPRVTAAVVTVVRIVCGIGRLAGCGWDSQFLLLRVGKQFHTFSVSKCSART